LPLMLEQTRQRQELQERVRERTPQDEKAEERLSVDDPNPLFSFLETPHHPEPRRTQIRDEVRRNKMVSS
jgi:hypothetical protein